MRSSSCRPIRIRSSTPSRKSRTRASSSTLVDRAPSNNDNTVRDLYVAGNNPALGQTAGEYIKANTPDAQVVVIRGLPIPIDQQRQDGFDKGIEGSNVKVLDRQFGNWNRDDAFKVMQDYLTKYPKIDVVWCQDDDMAVGVLQAIEQAKRTDIQYVVAGAGSKDMVKKVMDGDKLIPVDVLYPPAMVGTAHGTDRRQLLRPGSGSRHLHPRCDLGHQGQCQGLLLPRFTVLIGRSAIPRRPSIPAGAFYALCRGFAVQNFCGTYLLPSTAGRD